MQPVQQLSQRATAGTHRSLPNSQVTLQKLATSQPAAGYSLGITHPSPWRGGGEMFVSPLGTIALRTGIALHSCIFPLRAQGGKGSTAAALSGEACSLHSHPTVPGYPRIRCMACWRAQLALPEASAHPSAFSASSVNLNCQRPPFWLSPAAILADHTSTGDRKGTRERMV